jgi:hypothetical protein
MQYLLLLQGNPYSLGECLRAWKEYEGDEAPFQINECVQVDRLSIALCEVLCPLHSRPAVF